MINEHNYVQYHDFLEKAELMLTGFWDSEWVKKKRKNNSKLFAMYDDYIEKKAEQEKEKQEQYKKMKKFLKKMEESSDILEAVKTIKDVVSTVGGTASDILDEVAGQKLKDSSETLNDYFKPGSAEKLKKMTETIEGRPIGVAAGPARDEEPDEADQAATQENQEFDAESEALVSLGSILSVLAEEYFVADENPTKTMPYEIGSEEDFVPLD